MKIIFTNCHESGNFVLEEPLMLDPNVEALFRQLKQIQDSCDHTFTLKISPEETRGNSVFLEKGGLIACCLKCTKEIVFNNWDICNLCFKDITNVSSCKERDLFKYLSFRRFVYGAYGLVKTCPNCGNRVLKIEEDR